MTRADHKLQKLLAKEHAASTAVAEYVRQRYNVGVVVQFIKGSRCLTGVVRFVRIGGHELAVRTRTGGHHNATLAPNWPLPVIVPCPDDLEAIRDEVMAEDAARTAYLAA